MNCLVLLVGVVGISIANGLLDFKSNLTIVTPCGNVTNKRDNFGKLHYNRRAHKLEIKCAEGFTYSTRPSKKCNATLKNWIEKGLNLSCKPGNPKQCPPPVGNVATCVEACKNDSQCNDKSKKCCSNGCGHTCVASIAKGRCASTGSKYLLLMSKSACSENDKRFWCAGYIDKMGVRCIRALLRTANEFVDKMERRDIAIIMQSSVFRKNLIEAMYIVNGKTLGKLVAPLSEEQLKEFMKDFKSHEFLEIKDVRIRAVIVQIHVRIYGKGADKWPAEAFNNTGGVALMWLRRRQFSLVLKNPHIKEIIRSIDDAVVKLMVETESAKVTKIFNTIGNECSKLKSADLISLGQFLVARSYPCLDKIPTQEYCDALDKMNGIPMLRYFRRKAQLILKKLKTDGCRGKAFKDLTADDLLQRYSSLMFGADAKFINNLGKNQMSFDIAHRLCKEPWFSKEKKLAVINKLREKTSPSQWTLENLQKAWYCLNEETCEKVSKSTFQKYFAVKNVTGCLQTMASSSPKVLKSARKKADEILGKDTSSWGKEDTGCRQTLLTYTTSLKDAYNLGPDGFKNFATLQIKRFHLLKSRKAKAKRRVLLTMLSKVGKPDFNKFLSEVNCDMLKRNEAKVFIDLGYNEDSADSSKSKEESRLTETPDSVASCVVNLYLQKTKTLNKEDIDNLGYKICKGVSQKEIKKFDLDTVLAVYRCEGLSDSKCNALSERFKQLKGEVNPDIICEMGSSVACLPTETLKQLNADPEDGCSWIEKAGKADPEKLGKRKMQEMAKIATEKKDKIDKQFAIALGKLVNYVKKDDVKKFEDDAIPQAIKQTVSCKDDECKATQKEIVDRQRKKRKGKFEKEDVEEMGVHACAILTKLDVEQMDKKTVEYAQSILKDCVGLIGDIRDAVQKKLATSSRRRRDIDVSKMTAEQILDEGAFFSSPEDIKKVSFQVYVKIAKDIGEREYTSGQKDVLEAWAYVAKNGDASKMAPSLIEELGAVCRGLSADDIGKLNFATDDAIQGCSEKGLSRDQIEKGLARIKELKKKTISAMNQEDLVILGYFAVGMTTKEIRDIGETVYKGVYDTFNSLTGWNEDQLVELKVKLEKIKGPVSGWSEADFTEANVAVGGFTEDEIKSLSKEDIQAIPADGISSIPPSKMKFFSEEQLSYLSPKQASKLTDDQKKEALDYCKKMDLKCPESDKGTHHVAMGTVTFLMSFVVCVTSLV